MSNNPLLSSANTLPAFDRIREEHFKPALDEAFARAEQKYRDIRDNPAAPTFENTVAPFNDLFAEAGNIFRVLGCLVSCARTDTLKDIAQEASQTSNALSKKIYQDRDLAARFKEVYDQKDSLDLNDEDRWFLQNIYWSFESNGAFLDEAGQKELQNIDQALIRETKKFGDNIDESQKQQAFHFSDRNLLAGVPEDIVSGFEKQARDKGYQDGWLFMPERLLVDQLLEVAGNREFRERIFNALNRLGTEPPYDNRPVIQKIGELRDKRARLLGYDNYAEYHLSGTMAGSLENVVQLFEDSLEHMLPKYEEDMRTLESWAAQDGGPSKLEPWDASYYAARYKEQTFQFDAGKLSEYLELENVLNGWIAHAGKAFGLDFEEVDNIPAWNEDVRVFKATNRETGEQAVLYIDPYARQGSKRGGAWMSSIQTGDPATGKLNAISFNMNLVKPADGQKTLLNVDQLRTFYHEGGHALNGLTGTQPKYSSRRGTGNGSDFVEIHSMLQENWAIQPEVLQTYAFHYRTGEVVPQQLIDTMQASDSFLATRDPLKVVQNSLRDFHFHTIPWESYPGDRAIEEAADLDSPYSAHIRSYPLTRFDHLFSSPQSQYAAGYYGYYLSDVNQAAAFEPFQQKGLYDPGLLANMREFYAAGAGLESNQAYERFTGQKSGNPRAYLKGLGINVDANRQPPPPAPPPGLSPG